MPKKWTSAVVAAALGLILLGAVEVTLRVRDFRLNAWYLDSPIFVAESDGIHVRTDPIFVDPEPYGFSFVVDQRFTREKRAGVLRIALVGESSVENLGKATPLAAELETKLGKPVEVLNFGFGGCGSERVLLSFEEALRYGPDAILVYAGHNEFVSFSNPATFADNRPRKESPPLRVVQLASKIWFSIWPPDRKTLTGKARTYTDAEKDSFYENFRRNLSAMVAAARARQLPIVFSTVAYNYAFPVMFGPDYPPDLSEAQRWDAPRLLREMQSHPRNPTLEMLLGYQLYRSGRLSEAREHIEKAFVLELRPIRANEVINQVIKSVALKTDTPLLDFHEILARETGSPLPGFDLFKDNCHLNQRGNAILMRSAAATLAASLSKSPGRIDERSTR